MHSLRVEMRFNANRNCMSKIIARTGPNGRSLSQSKISFLWAGLLNLKFPEMKENFPIPFNSSQNPVIIGSAYVKFMQSCDQLFVGAIMRARDR
jgi:hypothetical protein